MKLIGTGWIRISYKSYKRTKVIKTLTLSNKSSLNNLEYPFKKNFYQFA